MASSTTTVSTPTIQRVSTKATGEQSNESAYTPSTVPQVSSDGRFVVFSSSASDLVTGDTNYYRDLFLKDTFTGAVQRVNTSSTGTQANAPYDESPVMSSDGRYVAFSSQCNNLVSGDTGGYRDMFVKDTQSGSLQRVSVGAAGIAGNADSLGLPSISGDGRYVVFASKASNLAAGDINGSSDVFLKDTLSGAVKIVSMSSAGVLGATDSSNPVISADGRFVAFVSASKNLVTGTSNSYKDIFLANLQTGAVQLVSASAAGVEGNYSATEVAISADGHYVAFVSRASDLLPGKASAIQDSVYLKDMHTGAVQRISATGSGTAANGNSLQISISGDGRYVVFMSNATNLVTGTSDYYSTQVYVTDSTTGETRLASVNAAGVRAGVGNWEVANSPSISADGRYITFSSDAKNLIAGESAGKGGVFKVVNPFLSSSTSGDDALLGGAGNDIMGGLSGNDTIDGGAGIDIAAYALPFVNYALTKSSAGFTVKAESGSDGTDTLVNIERLVFTDVKWAVDLSVDGHAGQAALLLGAVLGHDSLSAKKELLGAVIGLFDAGYTLQQLSGAVMRLPVWGILANGGASSASNTQIANYLLTTVAGQTPDAAALATAVASLTNDPQGDLLWHLAESAANQTQINLVGLAATGLEYV